MPAIEFFKVLAAGVSRERPVSSDIVGKRDGVERRNRSWANARPVWSTRP